MIMRMTMIVMIMRMSMIMIMMSVIMRMIMATATPGAMSMMMRVIMTMVVSMIMRVPMIMTVMIMTVVTMRVIMIGAALRLEGARHRRHRAAQTPDHFSKHMILFDIDRIRGDLRGGMAIANMPRGFQKPHRIIRFNFDQRLRSGFDENE